MTVLSTAIIDSSAVHLGPTGDQWMIYKDGYKIVFSYNGIEQASIETVFASIVVGLNEHGVQCAEELANSGVSAAIVASTSDDPMLHTYTSTSNKITVIYQSARIVDYKTGCVHTDGTDKVQATKSILLCGSDMETVQLLANSKLLRYPVPATVNVSFKLFSTDKYLQPPHNEESHYTVSCDKSQHGTVVTCNVDQKGCVQCADGALVTHYDVDENLGSAYAAVVPYVASGVSFDTIKRGLKVSKCSPDLSGVLQDDMLVLPDEGLRVFVGYNAKGVTLARAAL